MRKLLCGLLAAVLICLSATCCLAADTVEFTDQQKIQNNNAVRMLCDLGLVSGYSDGSFGPQNYIRREEVAKLVALLSSASPEATQNAASVFQDVTDSWAAPYISYCAEQEIIVGSAGKFRPADRVTLRELAKMLLVILGEEPSRYTGSDWAMHVDEDAFAKGIYAGITASYSDAATRDEACLLIYNAMLCPKVADASQSGVQQYVLDALMNPMSYLEIRFGLTRYTATLTANECADLSAFGSKLPAGQSKLAGHKEFAISTDLSLLGRSVDIYVKDGKVFGVPCYAVDEVYYTFSDAAGLKDICATGGFRLTDETEYYYNYTRATKEILNTVTDNDKITVIDHNGDNAFDIVLVTNSRPATVTSVSPLTVELGGQSYPVQPFCTTDTFAVGDEVYYSQVCGSGYIRKLG